MGYAQGPLFLQSAANVGVVTSNYGLQQYAHDELGDVDAITAGWDSFLQDVGILLGGSSDALGGVDLTESFGVINAYSEPDVLVGYAGLLSGVTDGDNNVTTLLNLTPAEGWQPTPASFVPPGPAEKLGVPVIPADSLSVSVTGTVNTGGSTGPLNQPPAAIYATLSNLSSVYGLNFRVGDEWQLTAKGAVGLPVYVYATLNGQDIGGGAVGNIGPDSQFVLLGRMDTPQLGVWTEQVYVGSQLAATFDFVVSAS